MKILIWTPPWPTQYGSIFFHKNAFEKHLLIQAKTLAKAGCEVTVCCPDSYTDCIQNIKNSVKIVTLDSKEAISLVGGFVDPSPELYELGSKSPLSKKIKEWLGPQLNKVYDIILIWENPVPFLEEIFPNSLIVHQMPGAFSRPPYPHLVTFDIKGLYRKGTIHQFFDEILLNHPLDGTLPRSFRETVNNSIERFPVFDAGEKIDRTKFSKIGLLPLQISDHYAFKVDTPFKSQADFFHKVATSIGQDTALIVTQYVHRLYKDQIFDEDFHKYVKDQFRNVYFNSEFDKMPSVSQYLLPYADQLHTASSSLSVQAFCWSNEILVYGNTHYEKFGKIADSDRLSRDAVLDFLLRKNQFLASEVTSNENTLVNLLEEMIRARNFSSVSELPDISVISKNYERNLIEGFREEEARKSLKGIRLSKSNRFNRTTQKLKKLINDNKVELISFDLFDTLIERPLEAPADTYRLLELELKREDIRIPFDFAQKRLKAELAARLETDSEEIQLTQIYNVFKKMFSLSEADAELLVQKEIDIEYRLARPRKIGQQCWEIAKSSGIPICITSDMYLPGELIRQIIKKTGYSDADELYLSSEVNMTKKSGNLFRYIIAKHKLPGSSILHVGDNVRTDINSAKDAGINTLHLPRSVDVMKRNQHFRHAFARRQPIEDLPRSAMSWSIANRYYDDASTAELESMTDGDPEAFGFSALGPVLLGFTVWLRKQALFQDIDALFFLSREGRLIKSAYDILEGIAPAGIESKYLYGSRRAIRVPAMFSKVDVLDVAANPFSEQVTLGNLLNKRFGLQPENINIEKIRRLGFASLDVKMTKNKSASFSLVVAALCDEILENAEKERAIYLRYLHQVGFSSARRPGVVDVGWKANMQGSIGRLLSRPIDGFYFATLHDASRWEDFGHGIHSYYAQKTPVTEGSPILSHRLFMEYFWCENSPSVTEIAEDENGKCYPIFNSSQEPPLRRQLVDQVHAGALAHVRSLTETFGIDLIERDFSPRLVERCLNRFIANPSQRDVQVFDGHYFEDSFGGVSKGYIVSPETWDKETRIARSYWKTGARALLETDPSKNGVAFHRKTVRAKWVLALVWPFLKSDLNERERNEFHAEPWTLFGNAKDPAMILIGRLAGYR